MRYVSYSIWAQEAIRIIAKVLACFKRDKTIKPEFQERGTILYDDHNSRVKLDSVRLGEINLKTIPGEFQRERWNQKESRLRGQYQLVYSRSNFFLVVAQEIQEALTYKPKGILGVDFGVKNIAVDSDGEIFTSEATEKIRKKYNRQRTALQKKGTKSAKRKLKKMSGRERRFKKYTNYCIAKCLRLKAEGTTRAAAIEDLSYIRYRTSGGTVSGRKDRYSKWTYDELRRIIEYTFLKRGVPCIVAPPADTSIRCPQCGCINEKNRKSRDVFKCINTKCQYTQMADYVGSVNIAEKASRLQRLNAVAEVAVNQPRSGVIFYDSCKNWTSWFRPPVYLTGGS